MSLPYGQPAPQQQPGPTSSPSSPSGGLGLSKILAIVPGGLGLVIYFLSFTDGAGGYLRDLFGVLLLGGGLLAAASVLPKAPATLLPGTVAAVTGFLFLLVAVVEGPSFLDLPGVVTETPALAVVAVILALLESAACVAAVLLDTDVVKLATASRSARFPQRSSWAPPPGAAVPGAYPGGYAGPPGQPGGQPASGWPGPGAYPGVAGPYPGVGSGYPAPPGGYPGGPGPSGYPGQPPAGSPTGTGASAPPPDLSQTVEYRGPQNPYPGQPGQPGHQPGPYGAEPGGYGGEPGQYRAEPGRYASGPGQFGSEPARYGSEPGGPGSESVRYGGEPTSHVAEPGRQGGEDKKEGEEAAQSGRPPDRPSAPPGGFGDPGKG